MQFPSAVSQDSPFYSQGAPAYSGAPGATFDGGPQPAGSGWDPYGDPAALPPTISPYGGHDPQYAAPGACPYGGYGQPLPDGTRAPRTRLLHEIRIEDTWLARFSDDGFGVNSTNMFASFAMPFLYNPSPLVITPGFTYHSWDGPDSTLFLGSPDLPARAYDAYLDTAWRPQVTSWFGADLGVRVGVYSDFNSVTSDSIRIQGRGLAVITFSPQFQIAAGVWYLDRLRVKLLPAGGIIWTPNPDTRLDIVFPNPKLAQRLTTVGNTDIWGYLAGEYGGGKWTIERASGMNDTIDYNDIRVMLGLEWINFSGLRGNFEVGYVFDREIVYRSGTPDVKPSDTLMLRLGLSY